MIFKNKKVPSSSLKQNFRRGSLGHCIAIIPQMDSFNQVSISFQEVFNSLSRERLLPFREKYSSDYEVFKSYCWNIQLSQSLYPLLHFPEVSLRNAIHSAGCVYFKKKEWIQDEKIIFDPRDIKDISMAISRFPEGKQKAFYPGDLVAALTFGFWSGLLKKEYEVLLWHPLIEKVFPNCPSRHRTRKNISIILNNIRKLRNRVFHHEPIYNDHALPKTHEQIYEVLGWVNENLVIVTRPLDGFIEVYTQGEKSQ
jgi:hypothetical protein